MCKKQKMKTTELYNKLLDEAAERGHIPEECEIIAEKAYIEGIFVDTAIHFLKRERVLIK